MNDQPRLWRVSEAAAFLGSSRVSCYRALESGVMPGFKVSGVGWRLDPDELKAWIESQRNATGVRDRGGSRPPRLSLRPRTAGLTGEQDGRAG